MQNQALHELNGGVKPAFFIFIKKEIVLYGYPHWVAWFSSIKSVIASLGLYLFNNTISDHEVKTKVSLSEIKDFLLAKGMSNYEAESEINV